MLKIKVPATELFNELTGEISKIKEQELMLEHSLISISKWESEYQKPFLNKTEKTTEEIMYYIKCMTITPHVRPEVYLCLTKENLKTIVDYIKSPQSATTFSKTEEKPSREIITSEYIYYGMIANNIPVEFEKWHINRLLALIKICNIKNNPNKKKMTQSQIMSRNRALNEARRAKLHSKG